MFLQEVTQIEARQQYAPTIVDPNAMTGSHMGYLFSLARIAAPQMPLRVLYHAASMTAKEKQNMLPAGIHVQKSISLLLGNHLLLVSGIGDFQLKRSHYAFLARVLLLKKAEAKRRKINPVGFSSWATCGLAAGMVSPFFPPYYIPVLPYSAVILLPPTTIDVSDQVAISLSLASSLLYPACTLNELVRAYALRYYHPYTPIVEMPALL